MQSVSDAVMHGDKIIINLAAASRVGVTVTRRRAWRASFSRAVCRPSHDRHSSQDVYYFFLFRPSVRGRGGSASFTRHVTDSARMLVGASTGLLGAVHG